MVGGESTIVAFGTALRLYHLDAQSYWLDELSSLEATTGRGFVDQELPRGVIVRPGRLTRLDRAPPVWRIWTTMQMFSHPPGFYVVLRGWRVLFGDGEAAVRMLSVVCSLASVVLVYFVGERLAGRAGLWAAGLMAVSPLQVL